MKSSNQIRFGLNPRGISYERIVASAQAAEAAGFSHISFADRPFEENIEAWTLATAVGMVTTRIILTHSTLNIPYRNPAMVAKMAASLDVITGGGRVTLTLAAGGSDHYYTPYGIVPGTPGERYNSVVDTVRILKGLWANDSFSYEGKRFSVQDAVVAPKPVNGTIPIIIAANKPRMQAFTGAVADGWIKGGGWPESPEHYERLLAPIEEAAERAGRDPASLRRVVNCAGYVGDRDPATVMPSTRGAVGGLMGTADQVAEIVAVYNEAGIDTFNVQFDNDLLDEQIPRFGEEVIARFR